MTKPPALTRQVCKPYSHYVPPDNQNISLRLNKALAQAGLCSRRAADELILRGEVRVNGVLIQNPGVRVDPLKDLIQVRGRDIPLDAAVGGERLYLAMNKPPGVVTTASDPQCRKTVMDLLPAEMLRQRPFSVGRLDLQSEGLLLLTNDGDLALRMTHPRWEHPKTYQVWVRGRMDEGKLETMRGGMHLAEGDRLAPVDVRVLPFPLSGTVKLEMTLRQGVNRQIRRMCRDLRLHILRLRRVSQGPIRLGEMPVGVWRHLAPSEITALRESLGLSGKST